MKDQKINSGEIAKMAGVSRSTVSRVLNNPSIVKPETREKVMDVIKEVSYYPNISAQVLAGKASNTIGLFFASNPAAREKNIDNVHTDYMLRCVLEAAATNDFYTLTSMIYDIEDKKNKEKIVEMFSQQRIDAGIFIAFPDQYSVIEELVEKGYTVGILDYDCAGKTEPNRIVVNFDDVTAENAVDYLVSLGHKDILAIHGDLNRYNGVQKYNAFLRGMEKNNIDIRKDWMIFTDFAREAAFQKLDRFFEKSSEIPTAIYCANDALAFGAIDAAKNHGLSVPEDISIIGIDDVVFSKYFVPSLTTYCVNFDEMLTTLTEKVIARINGRLKEHFHCEFGSRLIVRDSCKEVVQQEK